jgi:hypothetical protein
MDAAFSRHWEVAMANRAENSSKTTPIDFDLTSIALAVFVGDGMARDLLERLTEERPGDVTRAHKAAVPTGR